MERISSRFFQQMPEPFMEPPPCSSSLHRTKYSCPNAAFDDVPPCFSIPQNSDKKLERDTDNSCTSNTYTVKPSNSTAKTSPSPPNHASTTAHDNGDVFIDHPTAHTVTTTTTFPSSVIRDATPEELETAQAAGYDIDLLRFTEMFDYYILRPASTERWASNLGLTSAEWEEKLDETEAQVYLNSLIREEKLRDAQLDSARLLMALWRHQARLDIRAMGEPTPNNKRLSSMSSFPRARKSTTEFRNSRTFERVRRIASQLHKPRTKPEDTRPQTVLAISYSSTSIGPQPHMTSTLRWMPLPATPHQSKTSLILKGKQKIGPPTPVMPPPRPIINVISATPKNDSQCRSEVSSIVDTPTRKPVAHPDLLPKRLNLAKPRPKSLDDSKIAPPRFMTQTQQSKARTRPTCPPRAIAKAVKSLHAPSQDRKSSLQAKQNERYPYLAPYSTDVYRKPPDRSVASSVSADTVTETKQTKKTKAAARYEGKLQKAREDVARRSSQRVSSSGVASKLGETKRASMASFLSTKSKTASERASWISFKEKYAGPKHSYRQLTMQQELGPPTRFSDDEAAPAPIVPRYRSTIPSSKTTKSLPKSPSQKTLPSQPDGGIAHLQAKEDKRLKRLAQHHFHSEVSLISPNKRRTPKHYNSDPSIARAGASQGTAPLPITQRKYKTRSVSERTLKPESMLRQQSLKRVDAVHDFRKFDLHVKPLPPHPPQLPPMERVGDLFAVKWEHNQDVFDRIQRRHASLGDGRKGREMLGLENGAGARSSVVSVKAEKEECEEDLMSFTPSK